MDRAKTDHLLVETEAAFQGRSAAATPVRAVGKHSLPISTAGNWFDLESLCQVESVLALATDRISNISATPIHRLCTRMKSGMWDDSGNQSLIARAAIEDTTMPTPVYHTYR